MTHPPESDMENPVALARELRKRATLLADAIDRLDDITGRKAGDDRADLDVMQRAATYLESLSAPGEDEEKPNCSLCVGGAAFSKHSPAYHVTEYLYGEECTLVYCPRAALSPTPQTDEEMAGNGGRGMDTPP